MKLLFDGWIMGGHAFGFEAARMSRDKFVEVSNKFLNYLDEKAEKIAVVKAYNNKTSFGDIDILVSHDFLIDDFIKFLRDIDSRIPNFRNGDVTSFLLHDDLLNESYQIDVIRTKENQFETSYGYFANNDMGNFMGRIAHKLNMKYGVHGLSIIIRQGEKPIGEIMVSTDQRVIHEILGFPEYKDDFDELVDVFEYIKTSKYFRPEIYLFENQNNKNRVRDKKRTNYNALLDYIKDYTNDTPVIKFNQHESVYYAQRYNANVVSQYYAILEKQQRLDNYATKFNGNMIMSLIDIKGKSLGDFITRLISTQPTKDQFIDFISTLSDNEVKQFILAEYDEYNHV